MRTIALRSDPQLDYSPTEASQVSITWLAGTTPSLTQRDDQLRAGPCCPAAGLNLTAKEKILETRIWPLIKCSLPVTACAGKSMTPKSKSHERWAPWLFYWLGGGPVRCASAARVSGSSNRKSSASSILRSIGPLGVLPFSIWLILALEMPAARATSICSSSRKTRTALNSKPRYRYFECLFLVILYI